MKLGPIARGIVLCLMVAIFGYVVLKAYKAECRKGLAEAKQEIARLEKISPESHYRETIEKLLRKKRNYEQAIE